MLFVRNSQALPFWLASPDFSILRSAPNSPLPTFGFQPRKPFSASQPIGFQSGAKDVPSSVLISKERLATRLVLLLAPWMQVWHQSCLKLSCRDSQALHTVKIAWVAGRRKATRLVCSTSLVVILLCDQPRMITRLVLLLVLLLFFNTLLLWERGGGNLMLDCFLHRLVSGQAAPAKAR